MKGKLSYGFFAASLMILAGTVGNVHAAWDTSGVDLVLDQTVYEELDDLAAVLPELGDAVLTAEETEVAIKTLLPSAVATSVSGGVQATGAASTGSTLGRVAKLRSEALYARLQQAPVGPGGPTSSQNILTSGVWGKAVGSIGDQDDINGDYGYEYDTKGAMFGFDWLASRNWLVGVNVGSVSADIDAGYNQTANTKIDSVVAGLYATYSRGIDYLDLGFSFVKGDISSRRQFIVDPIAYNVSGETDFSTYVLYANLGRNFVFNSRHIVNPYLGGQFSNTSVDGYSETGVGALQFANQDTNLFNTNLGVKYEYIAGNQIHLKARASWAHEWSNNLQSVTRSRFTALGAGGAYFETKGLDVGADRFGLGLGLKLNMTENLDVDLDYDLEMAEEFISHAGSFAFKYKYY